MVDTQRFAIWHPSGMPDNTAPKKPTLIPPPNQPPSRFSRNIGIGQILKEYHWKDDTRSSSLSIPQSSPTNPIPSSSRFRPSGAPQQPTHLDTQDEDDEEESTDEDDDTSEDENSIILVPVRRVAPTIAASAPVRTLDNRANLPDKSRFQNPNDPTKRTESKSVSFAPASTSFKVSTIVDYPKTPAAKQRMSSDPIPLKEVLPEPKPLKTDRTEPVISAVSKGTQPKISTGWKERTNSVPPVPQKLAPPKPEPPRQERSDPITHPSPKPSLPKTDRPRPATQGFDMGYLANNSLVTLNAFLVQLQETAFDGFKMTMMEASIRQFHLIAADADIQLTRELVSMKAQNASDMRSKLIERHRMFLEEQAHTVLDGMHEYHLQLRDKYLKAINQGEGWEAVPPELLTSEARPEPEPVLEKVTSEVTENLPAIWKPTVVDDSAPPTPKMAIDEAFERVQADLERDKCVSLAPPAPPPTTNKVKSLPNKNVRTDESSMSNLSIAMQTKAEVPQSKPNEKPTAENTPEKPAEKSSEPPADKSGMKPATKPATTTTMKPTMKPKTAKELRAEKNRKGKNKATDAQQPGDPLESAIDNMMSTGNVQEALEQMAGAWR